ncbi:YaaC family protein [Streptomyces sp. NPDC001843]|uniref:YaaC family protein n=1 Tax=Streptomyces sp. NPDC001843 TaxID=3364617 RepID=UPI0036BE9A57
MNLPQPRPFNSWVISAVHDPKNPPEYWSEGASIPLILENLRRHAEIANVGRKRFSGTLAQKNKLWLEYRNFMRQALSNFQAALAVPNRSSCLLYYYAMLNFAKAELLTVRPSDIQGVVHHGLSFSPGRQGKSVAGDSLTVRKGVFPWLYEHRTGRTLPVGTKLPIRRLIPHIPQVGSQSADVGWGSEKPKGLHHVLVFDGQQSWPVILLPETGTPAGVTGRLFRQHFEQVEMFNHWRDVFGLSRRLMGFAIYQARRTAPHLADGSPDLSGALDITWQMKDILASRDEAFFDGILCPSFYSSKLFPMPPDLARYAVTYYASSLVRYKPSVFDFQLFPEQALLFDAIARECALPMLIDTFSALEGRSQLFADADTLRV